MNTIYSIYKKQAIAKGLVEIINVYDNRYFEIAVDGKIIESIYKNSFEGTVLTPSFISKCVEVSGVTQEELFFVLIDWMDLCDENIPDYDANDFEKYRDFVSFLKANPSIKYRNRYGVFIKDLAKGVTELEKKL